MDLGPTFRVQIEITSDSIPGPARGAGPRAIAQLAESIISPAVTPGWLDQLAAGRVKLNRLPLPGVLSAMT
jgi:hypothetical protein